jgi:hypothetical protein
MDGGHGLEKKFSEIRKKMFGAAAIIVDEITDGTFK